MYSNFGAVCFSSWAEHNLVVAANGAGVHHRWIVCIVLGIGIGIWACIFEGFSSGGGDVSRPVCVVAAIPRTAGERVWRLAEAAQIINGAADSSTTCSVWRPSTRNGCGAYRHRQIVGILQT